MRLIELFWL